MSGCLDGLEYGVRKATFDVVRQWQQGHFPDRTSPGCSCMSLISKVDFSCQVFLCHLVYKLYTLIKIFCICSTAARLRNMAIDAETFGQYKQGTIWPVTFWRFFPRKQLFVVFCIFLPCLAFFVWHVELHLWFQQFSSGCWPPVGNPNWAQKTVLGAV